MPAGQGKNVRTIARLVPTQRVDGAGQNTNDLIFENNGG